MNPLWSIIWLLILIFIAFFVAAFCAGWYILLYPLTVCIPALSVSIITTKILLFDYERVIHANSTNLQNIYNFYITGFDRFIAQRCTIYTLLCTGFG